MVSRMTAAVLMEKALQGSVSGVHWNDLKGKLRLYAHWMTEASWKDPILQNRKHVTSSTVRILRFDENDLILPVCGMIA